MNHLSLRKIEIEDLRNLQKISIQTFRETFDEVNTEEDMQKYVDEKLNVNQLQSELENPESEFYFAENNDKILGYLKLNFGNAQTENSGKDGFEIERIYVLKDFIGQKIGNFLFEKSIEIGKKRKMNFVWLGVWEKNERAINFYEKQGFEVFNQHDFVLGNDVQTDLLMKLNF